MPRATCPVEPEPVDREGAAAQFVRMARELPPVVTHYCEVCCQYTSFEITEVGQWEYHRCTVCHVSRSYRVR